MQIILANTARRVDDEIPMPPRTWSPPNVTLWGRRPKKLSHSGSSDRGRFSRITFFGGLPRRAFAARGKSPHCETTPASQDSILGGRPRSSAYESLCYLDQFENLEPHVGRQGGRSLRDLLPLPQIYSSNCLLRTLGNGRRGRPRRPELAGFSAGGRHALGNRDSGW